MLCIWVSCFIALHLWWCIIGIWACHHLQLFLFGCLMWFMWHVRFLPCDSSQSCFQFFIRGWLHFDTFPFPLYPSASSSFLFVFLFVIAMTFFTHIHFPDSLKYMFLVLHWIFLLILYGCVCVYKCMCLCMYCICIYTVPSSGGIIKIINFYSTLSSMLAKIVLLRDSASTTITYSSYSIYLNVFAYIVGFIPLNIINISVVWSNSNKRIFTITMIQPSGGSWCSSLM